VEKTARMAAWACAVISLIGGVLSLIFGIGLITLILILIMGACLLAIILINKNLKKTYQRSPVAAIYLGYAGWFLMLISLLISQLRH
jgi:hypothetical protein